MYQALKNLDDVKNGLDIWVKNLILLIQLLVVKKTFDDAIEEASAFF